MDELPPNFDEMVNEMLRRRAILLPDCPICYDKITGTNKMIELQCGHKFHKDCLARWAGNPKNEEEAEEAEDAEEAEEEHKSCPICGGPLEIKQGGKRRKKTKRKKTKKKKTKRKKTKKKKTKKKKIHKN
jgi:hypothetical protein